MQDNEGHFGGFSWRILTLNEGQCRTIAKKQKQTKKTLKLDENTGNQYVHL